MIIDSSAVIAILRRETGHERLGEVLSDAPTRHMSAATYAEAGIVADSRGPIPGRRFDEVLHDFAIEIVPLTAEHARIARQAYRDYGRGSGHPANLNFGDCFSYALASERREPLLYAGDDFVHTDVRSALD